MIKKILLGLIHALGFSVVRLTTLSELKSRATEGETWKFVQEIPTNHIGLLIKWISHSRSELKQDIFVLNKLNFKSDGFFVEFGATNGITGSNTFLLEKEFNWQGLLAEPARSFHKSLRDNRLAKISTDCIWKESGVDIAFSESKTPSFSTISQFTNLDLHSSTRKNSQKYNVKSISLYDFLTQNSAPREIDYLSIDTEGSEYEILSAFDFNSFRIKIISVEHNYTKNRKLIHGLLTSNGFSRVHEEFSKYDDWYVNKSI